MQDELLVMLHRCGGRCALACLSWTLTGLEVTSNDVVAVAVRDPRAAVLVNVYLRPQIL